MFGCFLMRSVAYCELGVTELKFLIAQIFIVIVSIVSDFLSFQTVLIRVLKMHSFFIGKIASCESMPSLLSIAKGTSICSTGSTFQGNISTSKDFTKYFVRSLKQNTTTLKGILEWPILTSLKRLKI